MPPTTLALQRYRAGLGNYLIVLTAETNVLTQRRADHRPEGARTWRARSALVRALGGGYDGRRRPRHRPRMAAVR